MHEQYEFKSYNVTAMTQPYDAWMKFPEYALPLQYEEVQDVSLLSLKTLSQVVHMWVLQTVGTTV